MSDTKKAQQAPSTANIGALERADIADLATYYKNARRGDVGAIAASMQVNGVYRPLVVNRGTHTGRPMEVLAGNHSLMAMRRLAEENPDDARWQRADVYVVDVDEDRATRIVLADNRTSELGGYDDEQLLELVEAVDYDLDGTGYDYDDLDVLRDLADGAPGLDDMDDDGEDAAPEKPEMTTEEAGATLADRFGVPPFTVINTTKGGWQQRKRAWLALGIASHEGREEELAFQGPVNRWANWYDVLNIARRENPEWTDDQIEEGYAHLLRPMSSGAGTSVFDPVLGELMYAWFTKEGDSVLDPWAGGSVRGVVAATTGRAYCGHELRQEQVDANVEQWGAYSTSEDTTGYPVPEWITGDSTETMRQHADTGRAFDFILGCPPYYDLEEYSDDPADLSNLEHADFDKAMALCLAEADNHLRDDRFAVFVVGSVRDARGHILDMRKTMQDAAPEGWRLVNDLVLLNSIGSARLRAARAFTGTRTVTRIHQDVLVFVKGDRKKAAQRLGDVAMLELPDTDEDAEGGAED